MSTNKNPFDDYFHTLFNITPKTKDHVKKTETGYQLMVAVPGFAKEELEISVPVGKIVISVKDELKEDDPLYEIKKEYKGSSYQLAESFNVSNIKARLESGVLIMDIERDYKKEVKVEIK